MGKPSSALVAGKIRMIQPGISKPIIRKAAVAGFVLLLVMVFIWRRPVEWQHPYVWVEEGTVSLPAYLASGWLSLVSPVSGYLVLPAKFILLVSLTISASHYPAIAYFLTVAFEVTTLCLIAYSPSWLKYPRLAALMVALVPTLPEVFAVSEYAFWWGALWSFVAIFWREGERPRTAWRTVLVLVGGLSSPMALPAAVLLAIRAAWTRSRTDLIVGAAAAAAATVQAAIMLSNPSPLGIGDRGIDPVQTVVRFFGHYVISSPRAPGYILFAAGAAIIGGLVAFAIRRRKWRDPWFVLLTMSLCAGIVATLSRVPVGMIHPVGAARYFFFPYLFLSWILLQAFGESGRVGKTLIAGVLTLSVSQFVLHGRQAYQSFEWPSELQRCLAKGDGEYAMPVQFNGDRSIAWHVNLSGNDCKRLVDRSLFR